MEDRGGVEVAQTGCCITKCKNSAFLADVVLFTFPDEAERSVFLLDGRRLILPLLFIGFSRRGNFFLGGNTFS